MSDWTVRAPADDAEMARLAQVLATCFVMAPDRSERWLERSPRENLRVAVGTGGGADAVAGGMCLVPMGQSFGGRIVPLVGVAGVGVAPEARGRAVARELMTQMLRDERARGTALSALYPATEELYRLAGYEVAGSNFEIACPADSLVLREREPAVRRITDEDEGLIHALHERFVRLHPGNLHRGPYIWFRVTQAINPVDGYVLENGGGYVYLYQERHRDGKFVVHATDLVAFTHGDARRLLSFLGDHRSLVSEVWWMGGPHDAFASVLPSNEYRVKLDTHWMLRLVHVKAALEARGYPVGLTSEIHLRVRDDVLPENDGAFVLRVADGSGSVEPGGSGAVDVDVRGLAALYSGFASPADVAMRGQIDAPPDAAALLAATFAGPAPWMRDFF